MNHYEYVIIDKSSRNPKEVDSGTISLLGRPNIGESVSVGGKKYKVDDIVHVAESPHTLLELSQKRVGMMKAARGMPR